MNHKVSSRAEYRDQDQRFKRQRQDWMLVPLEVSPPPIVNWTPDIIAGAILVAAMVASFWVPDFLVWVLQ